MSVSFVLALYLYPVCQLRARPHFTPYMGGEPDRRLMRTEKSSHAENVNVASATSRLNLSKVEPESCLLFYESHVNLLFYHLSFYVLSSVS